MKRCMFWGLGVALLIALVGCQPDCPVEISEWEGLRIYQPEFSSMSLDCGLEMDEGDRSVVFACSGAFTLDYMEEFDHANIRGDHVSEGRRYGHEYTNDTIADDRGAVGLFAFYNGKGHFALTGASDLLDSAAANDGMAFGQYMIIFDGDTCYKWRSNAHQYRALCQMDSSLVVVESTDVVEYALFVDMLCRLGVNNAIYLDMGAWDDAWYRLNRKHIHRISEGCYPYLTNWIVFRQ